MQSERSFEVVDVYPVSAWKRGIDKGSPWWRQLFFDWVYMPFIRKSFHWIGIPCPKEAEVTANSDGSVTTVFTWYEDQGVFDSKELAAAACLESSWGYKPMPLNRLLPKESVKYGGKIYPRSDQPLRHAFPKYDLVPIPRRMLTKITAEIREEIARTHKALDA